MTGRGEGAWPGGVEVTLVELKDIQLPDTSGKRRRRPSPLR